jgi:hypothetical protein
MTAPQPRGRRWRIILHGVAVLGLTVLTQLGGLAWLAALAFRRGRLAFLAIFLLAYVALWGGAQVAAPVLGRVPLPCSGEVLRTQSRLYCVLLRNFVTPEMADVALDAAQAVAVSFPGTVTLALDGGFPFLDGMPLVPHLSHDDGEKLDFAFYYADTVHGDGAYLPGQSASAIGYFSFLRLGEETCPPVWPTLRWEMRWLEPLHRSIGLEPERTRALIEALAADLRVGKIFVEPPVAAALGVAGEKIRFQGCRAARHDDHIHVQL